jgi:hypothetical protein
MWCESSLYFIWQKRDTYGTRAGRGVQNGPSHVYEPDASPKGTDARTGGPALGPADRSLFFLLLAVERMLEPLLLPCEKTLTTKI